MSSNASTTARLSLKFTKRSSGNGTNGSSVSATTCTTGADVRLQHQCAREYGHRAGDVCCKLASPPVVVCVPTLQPLNTVPAMSMSVRLQGQLYCNGCLQRRPPQHKPHATQAAAILPDSASPVASQG